MGYSRYIRMYRVCVGYVSGMCRESVGRYRERKGFQGHGKRGKYLPRMARRDTETRNNYLLRAEREKSKLSKLQTDYYLQQPKQHKPTTHCARNNTASAKGIYVSTMKTMMINNTNNNILWRKRQETIVRPKGDKKSKLSKLINGVLFTTTITTYINNILRAKQHIAR